MLVVFFSFNTTELMRKNLCFGLWGEDAFEFYNARRGGVVILPNKRLTMFLQDSLDSIRILKYRSSNRVVPNLKLFKWYLVVNSLRIVIVSI